MGYGTGCCCNDLINLVKLNALTGAKIWEVRVPGAGAGNNATSDCGRVEALHGTNDIIVEVNDNTLCRVDSTGTQAWSIGHLFNGSLGGRRLFGSDGTNIVRANLTTLGSPGGTFGFNYAGSSIWSTSLVAAIAPTSFCVGASASVFASSIRLSKISNASGTSIWNNASGTGAVITSIDSNDDSLSTGGGTVTKFASATGNIITSAAYSANTSRFGGAGYSFITAGFNAVSGTSGTSLTQIFNTTTVGGATLSGILDTCNGLGVSYSALYYFAGAQQTGSGGTIFNIFCVDAAGSLVWAQRYSSGTISTDKVSGLCLSDDGFLYAAGSLSTK